MRLLLLLLKQNQELLLLGPSSMPSSVQAAAVRQGLLRPVVQFLRRVAGQMLGPFAGSLAAVVLAHVIGRLFSVRAQPRGAGAAAASKPQLQPADSPPPPPAPPQDPVTAAASTPQPLEPEFEAKVQALVTLVQSTPGVALRLQPRGTAGTSRLARGWRGFAS